MAARQSVKAPGSDGGLIITNWTAYTPVFVGGGAPTNLGTDSSLLGQWSRVGDSMKGQIVWEIGSSTLALGSGTWSIDSPTVDLSLTVDSGKHLSTFSGQLDTYIMCGSGYVHDGSNTADRRTLVAFLNVSNGQLHFLVNQGSAIGATFPAWADGDYFAVNFTIPILEWAL